MQLKKEIINENDEKESIIRCLFDSSNIIKTEYLPFYMVLYVYFKKGIVYSFSNIDKELYESFENSESQGGFFAKNIKNKTPYMKEYKMNEYEMKELIKECENNSKIK